MGSYIILYISTLLPVWELATGCDITEGTDWCGLVPVVREFLHMIPTQFFNGISGSVLCRCPSKERIIHQTIIARTPSHQSVDDCCLALPPRLWQPRNPEVGEATVIEGSLTFPHTCWVSQLDANFTLYPGCKMCIHYMCVCVPYKMACGYLDAKKHEHRQGIAQHGITGDTNPLARG